MARSHSTIVQTKASICMYTPFLIVKRPTVLVKSFVALNHFTLISIKEYFNQKHKDKHDYVKGLTSSLSSFDLCFSGSKRKSSVKRRHSLTFSGETKSRAILVHDYKSNKRTQSIKELIQIIYQ